MIVTRLPELVRRQVPTLVVAMLATIASLSNHATADRPEIIEETVTAEMFAAMDAGQIDVKYIPLDATKANILVTNKTDKPLKVKLPESFAGVPVLAQFGGGGFGGGGGGFGGGGGAQTGGGGAGGGGDDGGGFLNIPAERMRKVAAKTVCLEHGKPDPNPRIPYKIVPIEQFTQDARVRMLCKALGDGKLPQNTAQAAAWHLLDGLTWEELAAKNRKESKYTGIERWFSAGEIRAAMSVVKEANERADDSSQEESNYDKEYTGRYEG